VSVGGRRGLLGLLIIETKLRYASSRDRFYVRMLDALRLIKMAHFFKKAGGPGILAPITACVLLGARLGAKPLPLERSWRIGVVPGSPDMNDSSESKAADDG
jgi:hypothetical protein